MTRKGNYEVGYGRPPKETRFAPGQSGNAKGRSKGTRNLKTDLQEELKERITLGQGDGRIRLSKQRALVKSMVARAIKGEQRAADRCFDLLLKLIGTDDGQRPNEISAEDAAILANFAARNSAGDDDA
jgi:hypothetical protein